MLIGGWLGQIGRGGVARPPLQADYSALAASLRLGVVRIAWYAPLFVVSGAIRPPVPA